MQKIKVIIVGKLPPPFIGPAVATKIILNSELNKHFELLHLNTTVNKTVEEFGKGKLSKVGKNIAIYKNLLQLLRAEKPQLILIPISQTTLGFLKDSIFILLVSLFSTGILLQLRGSNFKNWMKGANPITRTFVKFCFNRTQGMIVLGNNLKHLFEGYYSPKDIYVIPNGRDFEFPERSKDTSKVQLLYFANFLPSKGFKELIEALVILKGKGVANYEMNAVGAWDNEAYKKECINLIKQHQLDVRFYEPMSGEEKWQSFANADVFLFTPNSPEGHPWVIVEALAAGLPIISTDQGAIIESVIHEKNGFIVESNQPGQTADRLELLIANEKLRDSFKKESRAHYLNNFTEQALVANMKSTFEAVLGKE